MSKNVKFPLKPFTIQCPHCAEPIEALYRGTILQFKVQIPGAGSQDVNPRRTFRPKYKAMLESSAPGDQWTIPANRVAWFAHASAPWLRRNPNFDLQSAAAADGSVTFTRIR